MMSDYIDPSNKELLNDFFEEAQLQIESLEQNILILENNPSNRNAIDEIFRAAHTLKGGSATVIMDEISGFTHIIENLLDDIRSEKVKVTGDVIDGLLESIDVIKMMIRYRQKDDIYSENNSELESKLNSFLASQKVPLNKKNISSNTEKSIGSKPTSTEKSKNEVSEYEILELSQGLDKNQTLYKIRSHFNQNAVMNTVGGIQIFAALKEIGKIVKTIPDFESLYEDNFFPIVDYFLSTSENIEKIRFLCDVPDIVLHTEIDVMKEGIKSGSDFVEQGLNAQVGNAKKSESEEEIVETAKKSEGMQADEESSKPESSKIAPISTVLRVESKRIDELMNLVSEAVITKASFNQISSVFGDLFLTFQETKSKLNTKLKDFSKTLFNAGEKLKSDSSDGKELKKQIDDEYSEISNGFNAFETRLKETIAKIKGGTQSLGRITNELQEGVMRIRMVPVSHIFSRFPRLVRDLSKELKKNVKLHTEGEETELDKSVIEDLIDPLIHCVRNSLDHGIEPIEERIKAGKPPDGNISLRATNEGNMIIIEIEDDGKGIEIEAIRAKAIEAGMIHPDKLLTDVEAYNLIFEPGFSTAKKITDLSGRGVGLDVVRKKVEKLNGSVSVWSRKGEGTTFTIKLPLTLAIIQGLLVRVGQEVYSIPITSVIESHRIKPQEIRFIDNYEVFNLREEVISIIRLNRLFKISIDEAAPYNYVVLVGSEKSKVGLMVDSLIGEEDVVIKPLKDKYSNSPGIAGATILGDGTVSLIIDVSQLLDLDLRIEKSKRQEREARIV